MTLLRTRIIASAVVFAANLVLSLSQGTAEARQRDENLALRRHQLSVGKRPARSAASPPVSATPKMSVNANTDYSEFCNFSGANAC